MLYIFSMIFYDFYKIIKKIHYFINKKNIFTNSFNDLEEIN